MYSKDWKSYIPDGAVNKAIAKYHSEQPERHQTNATPSSLTMCPRVIWMRYKRSIPITNEMGWGKKQRNMAGRMFEKLIAEQFKHSGQLLHWWADEFEGQSDKFSVGEGLTKLEGTPDLLLKLARVVISDAKTSRGDSFAYVPIEQAEIWQDALWNKNRIQLNGYYLLCHKNKDWFTKNKLPLPEGCHLFSYALDDGIARRELEWTPSRGDMGEVASLTKRWNTAYASEGMPDCTCDETAIKFCPYSYEFEFTKSGYKLGAKCCRDELNQKGAK